MTWKEAIEHFETMRVRARIHLKNCQAKQNRLPEEEKNLKRKIEAATLAIKAMEHVGKLKDGTSWMQDLQNASWED